MSVSSDREPPVAPVKLARLVPGDEVDDYLARGWRLSRRPLGLPHGRHRALMVLDDAPD